LNYPLLLLNSTSVLITFCKHRQLCIKQNSFSCKGIRNLGALRWGPACGFVASKGWLGNSPDSDSGLGTRIRIRWLAASS